MGNSQKRSITMILAGIMILALIFSAVPVNQVYAWMTTEPPPPEPLPTYKVTEKIGDVDVTFTTYGKIVSVGSDGEYIITYLVNLSSDNSDKVIFSKPTEAVLRRGQESEYRTVTETVTSLTYDDMKYRVYSDNPWQFYPVRLIINVPGNTASINLLRAGGLTERSSEADLLEKATGKFEPMSAGGLTNIDWETLLKGIELPDNTEEFTLVDLNGDEIPELIAAYPTSEGQFGGMMSGDGPYITPTWVRPHLYYMTKEDKEIHSTILSASGVSDDIKYEFMLWINSSGQIYFMPGVHGPLYSVTAAGGIMQIKDYDENNDPYINDSLVWVAYGKNSFNKAIDEWKPLPAGQLVTQQPSKPTQTAEPSQPTQPVTLPAPAPGETVTASSTSSTVIVNGEMVAFDAYNINDFNYFKLRDLAYVLNGTEKQFEVGWDGANDAISLTSGAAYTPAGGEMTGKGEGDKSAEATGSTIYLDGSEISFIAYNIEGNNYFKLRDIGEAFDFGVSWDGANNAIMIDTSIGYTAE